MSEKYLQNSRVSDERMGMGNGERRDERSWKEIVKIVRVISFD